MSQKSKTGEVERIVYPTFNCIHVLFHMGWSGFLDNLLIHRFKTDVSRGDGVATRLFALFFDVIPQLHIGCMQRQIGVSFDHYFYCERVSCVKHGRFFTEYILMPERAFRKFCALDQVFDKSKNDFLNLYSPLHHFSVYTILKLF